MLQPKLVSIIDPEKTGFVKGRNIFDKMRTVIHELEACKLDQIKGVLVFLDQKKAYDRVN
jgi:hypothetical protein